MRDEVKQQSKLRGTRSVGLRLHPPLRISAATPATPTNEKPFLLKAEWALLFYKVMIRPRRKEGEVKTINQIKKIKHDINLVRISL
jgi:hypothetical protein